MSPTKNPGAGQATGALQNDRADRHESNGSLTPAWIYDAEDRNRRQLEAEALAAGYRLAVQCVSCGAWLVAAKSVAAHRGPVCRARRLEVPDHA